jgi:hypothetical protein
MNIHGSQITDTPLFLLSKCALTHKALLIETFDSGRTTIVDLHYLNLNFKIFKYIL